MGENRFYRVSVWIVGDTIYIYEDMAQKTILFRSFCDGLKKRLIIKLLHPADSDFLPMNTLISGFLIEDINFDVIEFLAAADITKDEQFRGKVKGYLAGDTELEEFHKEVVAYHIAEKLSQ